MMFLTTRGRHYESKVETPYLHTLINDNDQWVLGAGLFLMLRFRWDNTDRTLSGTGYKEKIGVALLLLVFSSNLYCAFAS